MTEHDDFKAINSYYAILKVLLNKTRPEDWTKPEVLERLTPQYKKFIRVYLAYHQTLGLSYEVKDVCCFDIDKLPNHKIHIDEKLLARIWKILETFSAYAHQKAHGLPAFSPVVPQPGAGGGNKPAFAEILSILGNIASILALPLAIIGLLFSPQDVIDFVKNAFPSKDILYLIVILVVINAFQILGLLASFATLIMFVNWLRKKR